MIAPMKRYHRCQNRNVGKVGKVNFETRFFLHDFGIKVCFQNNTGQFQNANKTNRNVWKKMGKGNILKI